MYGGQTRIRGKCLKKTPHLRRCRLRNGVFSASAHPQSGEGRKFEPLLLRKAAEGLQPVEEWKLLSSRQRGDGDDRDGIPRVDMIR